LELDSTRHANASPAGNREGSDQCGVNHCIVPETDNQAFSPTSFPRGILAKTAKTRNNHMPRFVFYLLFCKKKKGVSDKIEKCPALLARLWPYGRRGRRVESAARAAPRPLGSLFGSFSLRGARSKGDQQPNGRVAHNSEALKHH
jgi:hypothetical protein